MDQTHRNNVSLETLRGMVGGPAGTSRWFDMTQAMIDDFARNTQDAQFIHVDPVRAAETPFGGTIAHGFLTLSMLSAMAYDAAPLAQGTVMGVNYGFDKIRFLSPVRAGARIRGHFVLEALDVTPHQITTYHGIQVEIEGTAKPALAATWITRSYFATAG